VNSSPVDAPEFPPVESTIRKARRRQSNPERRRRLKLVHERRHERLNGWFRLSFRGNKIRYIQLLTAPDDWLGATVWENLVTGIDSDGLPLFSWIIAEDDDPVRPLVPAHWQPHDCVFALAVELEQRSRDEFVVGEYVSSNGELRPRIGVIEQSAYNFFRPLNRLDCEGTIIRVKGTESGARRMYEFVPVAEAAPIEDATTLEQIVSSLDPAHHQGTLSSLPRGWFHMPFKRKALVADLLDMRTMPGSERAT